MENCDLENQTRLESDLRKSIEAYIAADRSEYRLAQQANITQGMLARFRRGKSISISTAGKLAAALRLRLR